MASSPILIVLQLAVGLGLLNVWMLRRGGPTGYRGGHAQTLRGEFDAYGLPGWLFFVVGGLKVVAGLALIAGIWVPVLVRPAALVVSTLMVGALAMHVKVKDPVRRSLPALAVLVMCLWIAKPR
jgi:uncharacterized membrane protein YphA (DoxX/SURF4 family)